MIERHLKSKMLFFNKEKMPIKRKKDEYNVKRRLVAKSKLANYLLFYYEGSKCENRKNKGVGWYVCIEISMKLKIV